MAGARCASAGGRAGGDFLGDVKKAVPHFDPGRRCVVLTSRQPTAQTSSRYFYGEVVDFCASTASTSCPTSPMPKSISATGAPRPPILQCRERATIAVEFMFRSKPIRWPAGGSGFSVGNAALIAPCRGSNPISIYGAFRRSRWRDRRAERASGLHPPRIPRPLPGAARRCFSNGPAARPGWEVPPPAGRLDVPRRRCRPNTAGQNRSLCLLQAGLGAGQCRGSPVVACRIWRGFFCPHRSAGRDRQRLRQATAQHINTLPGGRQRQPLSGSARSGAAAVRSSSGGSVRSAVFCTDASLKRLTRSLFFRETQRRLNGITALKHRNNSNSQPFLLATVHAPSCPCRISRPADAHSAIWIPSPICQEHIMNIMPAGTCFWSNLAGPQPASPKI